MSQPPAPSTLETSRPGQVSLWTLLRVFGRSLFLQASWNPQGMQNLGLAYALFPALKALYPDPERQMAAVRRHMAFFNTQPYMAAAILGGVIFHEGRIARGEEGPEQVVAFKSALMGPLAALGDGFFWLSLRPAVGALCAALVPALGAWAALLFLVLYNVVHLALRVQLFRMGLRLGDRLVEQVAHAHLPQWGARLRTVGAASAGAAVAYLAASLGSNQGGKEGAVLAVGYLALGVFAYWLTSKRFGNYALLYLAAALAVAAGAFL
ncbi:MAG TPA: PTS system mannose/fructose/sorbose family transporter subunit IID [Myxococcaceae bacterium]|nr:PTS system mannose/fructose/sorbose family transporter subunit IID [Myxococcaceae bacterium]